MTSMMIIPSNEDNYISFSNDFVVDSFTRNGKLVEITRTIRFLDTFGFMPSSLERLVSNLTNFPETQKWLSYSATLRRDVYPYEYIDSFYRFQEPLPPREAFSSCLSNLNQT